MTTTAIPVHLVAGEPTKTSLSYTINVNDGETYQHAYLEGWYFNHQLAKAMEDEGSEFDLKVFIWNMLADYGSEGTGPQTVTWKTAMRTCAGIRPSNCLEARNTCCCSATSTVRQAGMAILRL